MAPPKVLFVLTSHDQLADGSPTGWWLSEFAHPYAILAPHTSITIASPKGGAAPLDPKSVAQAEGDDISQKFLADQKSLWETTVPLSSVADAAASYAAIFYVGGHGPLFDLADDATSHALLRGFHDANKVVAAVCHGPAALANVRLDDGRFLLEGLKVTGFTDSEERAVGVSVPWSLEQRLDQASGGGFQRGADWGEYIEVARHGKVITGQNPASAGAVGKAILEELKKEKLV